MSDSEEPVIPVHELFFSDEDQMNIPMEILETIFEYLPQYVLTKIFRGIYNRDVRNSVVIVLHRILRNNPFAMRIGSRSSFGEAIYTCKTLISLQMKIPTSVCESASSLSELMDSAYYILTEEGS